MISLPGLVVNAINECGPERRLRRFPDPDRNRSEKESEMPARPNPNGISDPEQPEQGDNWRSIGAVADDVCRAAILRCPDLLTALVRYERIVRAQGGVHIHKAVDGTIREKFSHRHNMPHEWSAIFHTIIGLCDGSTELLEQVTDILASVELEVAQPSLEAMLCVAEDLVILARIYAGRLGG